MKNDSAGKQSHYEIVIEGHLDDRWQEWFEDFSMIRMENGRTVLTGPICDQAALYGVFRKINNLGLKLISINPK
jgi:wyosine [tRNA(Phe)-imidazoG37] synthetase (radical SAM superfamily)